jgi:hypothetical protein
MTENGERMRLAVRMLAGAIYDLVEASGLHALQRGETLPEGYGPGPEDWAAADETVSEVLDLLSDTAPIVRH